MPRKSSSDGSKNDEGNYNGRRHHCRRPFPQARSVGRCMSRKFKRLMREWEQAHRRDQEQQTSRDTTGADLVLLPHT